MRGALRSILLTLSVCAASAASAQEKPNIVLINLDNFGWGEPGFNGGGIIRGTATPAMDALAEEGMRLTNFNVEAQCTPSRAALMTGRYGIRSGNHTIPGGGGVYGLTQWEVTMAEMLKAVAYNTAMYGKWHLGWSEGRYPKDQGFDEFYGVESTDQTMWTSSARWQALGLEPPHVMEGVAGEAASVARVYDLEYRALIDADLTDKAIDFINRKANDEAPFFIYLAMTNMHTPSIAHPDFNGSTGMGLFADLLRQTDAYIGRVLEAIDSNGIRENTIVIFTADNGPEAAAKGGNDIAPQDHAQGSAGPWRGTLFTPFEGSLRVPFAMRWPGRIPAGSASNEIVHQMDLYPTLAAIVGGKVPEDRAFDGIDQSTFFLGEQDKSNRESVIVYMGSEIYGVKWRNWKLVSKENESTWQNTVNYSTPRVYDLINDPGELKDVLLPNTWVAEQAAPIVGEHLATFEKYPAIPPGQPDPYEPPAQ
ncbi:arylsulfatase [Ruegeria conchae]|uniref:arylsulfatase n=1 Tax=Ruegeria conchae TaxID=981384 RepID=UPI0029C7FE53|nr:arylsulfatase [Ruegeria conchae]